MVDWQGSILTKVNYKITFVSLYLYFFTLSVAYTDKHFNGFAKRTTSKPQNCQRPCKTPRNSVAFLKAGPPARMGPIMVGFSSGACQ
jgi:hypothetical protein